MTNKVITIWLLILSLACGWLVHSALQNRLTTAVLTINQRLNATIQAVNTLQKQHAMLQEQEVKRGKR